ncbi:thiamine pyrophosphate-binding protein [Epibacterium ulvae]|uniref:thiamine pyrophosphate-binding protein n=1 Tax=Epibacterium ulvae TaxID=1156985 RepID=UPI002491B7DE|nr:thiamine pyrophosphate-binding protein [Epibacterium ulvae]
MRKPLGAQISHMLCDRGVEVIFGVPGVHNQEMYRGIDEAGIRHVLARHEQGAGFMADGYARATGQPGVAYVITGPGLTNIMTAMGQAYSDSVSMLVLSSCLDEVDAQRGQLHQMKDQRAAAETVADWSVQCTTPASTYRMVERAFEEFELERPRPKHIQVTRGALEAVADPAAPPAMPAMRATSGAPDVAPVVSLLGMAKRPLFILGGGAQKVLWRDVLEPLGIATFTTIAGAGAVGLDYALDFGSSLARGSSADVIGSADLVVAIGTELAEVDLWRDHLGHTASLVRIDLDPEVLADDHAAQIKLCSDAESFARAFWDATKDRSAAMGWDAAEVQTARQRWRSEVEMERPGIVAICDALRAAVPLDAMIYSDMTQFAYVANEVWPMSRPGHWHHPAGFGTLGYALPAAIGGAVARPGKPTLAIAGDYGFHYTLQELGVAVELGLPLPILLWDNARLKEIEESMERAQIAPFAVAAKNPDFCKLAEAFGAASVAPTTLEALQEAVKAAFVADGPTLIYMTPALTQG